MIACMQVEDIMSIWAGMGGKDRNVYDGKSS